MNDLDIRKWELEAVRRFGDCKMEAFDPSRAGCRYFAKNALSAHGDYRLGGKALENGRPVANNNDDAQIASRHPQLKVDFDDPQLPPSNNCATRRATRKSLSVYVRYRKRAAAYVRISEGTLEEDLLLRRRGQERPVEQFIQGRGWRRVQSFVDMPHNKPAVRRRQLEAMMAAATRGEFDVVVISRLDRFAKDATEFARTVRELHALGVDFVSVEDGLDTTTKDGRALFFMMAVLTRMDRNQRSERAEAGMENAKRHGTKTGKQIGRPRATVDLTRLQRLRAKGWSLRRISRKLGLSPATVKRAYIGNVDGAD